MKNREYICHFNQKVEVNFDILIFTAIIAISIALILYQLYMCPLIRSFFFEEVKLNQRQLKYFLKVYKTRSITKAAKELFISPQGLSKTIASLEDELGVPLFDHKHNRISPTKNAVRLVAHAKNILDEYEIISNRLFTSNNPIKTLVIRCSYDIPQLIPADFFYKFHNENPEIRIKLVEYPDNEIISSLENGNIELAIIPGPFNTEKMDFDLICTEPFCLVINKDHPLAKNKYISIEQLANEPLVIKDISTPTSLSQMQDFLRAGAQTNIILEVSDTHLIHQMAENNYAIGMSLLYLAKKIRSEKVRILYFENNTMTKNIFLTRNKGTCLSYEADVFRNALLDYFSSFCPE